MSPADSAAIVIKRIFLAMGTQVSVTLALDHAQRRSEAETALDEIEQRITRFGRDCWAWGDGRLAQINRELEAGGAVTLPADLQPLFRRAWQIRQKTGGLYEPRVAALVKLWGFADINQLGQAPPAAAQLQPLLAALRSAPDYDGGEHYGPAPQTGWDFGGIGKGYIVDAALEQLRMRGYAHAIVDAGGNLAARGSRGDRPWHIGIRDPRVPADSGLLLASLDVCDETVNTHGDDQRYFEYQGRRYAHILDPRSGEPVQGLHALTVVHADGCVAEAEGAALFVAGAAGWREMAARLGIEQVLVVTGGGRVQATAALAARLRAQPGGVIDIVD
ncbi:MAG: FAD:protein transferase [Nevskia sp.]|nr:FAD:protein transferase [Nevskia sp.]